jgi:Fe-S cluster assembly protein SufD
MSVPAHNRYAEQFRGSLPTLPGAHTAWVRALRERAMATFLEKGFPSTHVEDWKYTDLRPLTRHHFIPSSGSPAIDASPLPKGLLEGQPVHRLVFIDGRFAPELCPFNTGPEGATLTSLAAALESEPQGLEPWLGHNTDLALPGFNALNTACMRDGVYLDLAPGVELAQPVHLVFIATGQPDTATTLRNLVVAGPGSKARIIESYLALGDARYLTNAVTEIFVGDGADIEHYKLEQESASAYHMAGIYVNQQRDSRYASHNIALGGRLVRNALHVGLDAPGADCMLNGLYVTRGRQHVDNHIRIDHRTPRASSRQWYKGVLDERSRAVFNGRVIVHPDAQKTDARQSNHNLLLSDDAEADAKPQLEIYADDVKCAHGCTVGRLDEEAIYYLRSRAIDESTARNFLIHAFAADVLQRMGIAPVQRFLERQLLVRLQSEELASLYRQQEDMRDHQKEMRQ